MNITFKVFNQGVCSISATVSVLNISTLYIIYLIRIIDNDKNNDKDNDNNRHNDNNNSSNITTTNNNDDDIKDSKDKKAG